MDKCVTKPPKPTNQSRPRSSKPSNKTEDMSSNHITPLSHVTISAGDTRRQRIRSAPVRRASGGEGRVLTRERSQERKLSSGFTSDHHTNKNPSPEHKQTDKTRCKPDDIVTAMVSTLVTMPPNYSSLLIMLVVIHPLFGHGRETPVYYAIIPGSLIELRNKN